MSDPAWLEGAWRLNRHVAVALSRAWTALVRDHFHVVAGLAIGVPLWIVVQADWIWLFSLGPKALAIIVLTAWAGGIAIGNAAGPERARPGEDPLADGIGEDTGCACGERHVQRRSESE